MISKISVWAPTRDQAIQKMSLALRETVALGVTTNRKFLIQVLQHPRFQSGKLSTRFIDQEGIHKQNLAPHPDEDRLAIVPMLWGWHLREQARTELRYIPSGWRYVKHKKQQDGYYGEVSERLIELQYEHVVKPGGWVPPNQKLAEKKFEVLYRAVVDQQAGEWRRAEVGLGKVVVDEDELGERSGVLRCTIGKCTQETWILGPLWDLDISIKSALLTPFYFSVSCRRRHPRLQHCERLDRTQLDRDLCAHQGLWRETDSVPAQGPAQECSRGGGRRVLTIHGAYALQDLEAAGALGYGGQEEPGAADHGVDEDRGASVCAP